MTRGKAIEVLKDLWRYEHSEFSEKDIREALDIAINSLEIDERYELEYEQTVICPSHGVDCEDCPAYEPMAESEDKE